MNTGHRTANLDGEASDLRQALGNRPLRRLLEAFAAVNLAEWAFVTALGIYAYRVGGALAVGFVGFRFFPGALSSALLAPLVDSRPGVMTRITAVRVILLGLGSVAVLAGLPLAVALLITSIDAVVAAPYRPAQSRLLPTLARAPAEISAGAAGISMVKSLGQASGALLGGIGAAVVEPGLVMAGSAIAMLGAVVLTLGVDRRTHAMVHLPGALRTGLQAIPHVLAHEPAAPLVYASGLRTLIRGLWTAMIVIVALKLFGLGASGVGVLNGAAGVGALIALPIAALLTGRPRLLGPCVVAFIGIGVTLGAIGVLPHGGVLVVIVVGAWGISMALADATSLSLLHRLLNASTVSRTVGVMESIKLATEGVGALLAPALVALVGIRSALIVAGIPLPLTIALSVPSLRRSDRAAAGRGRVVSLLHGVSALRSLDMASIEDVAARARRVEFPAGTDVVRYGEEGDDFYVIEAGETEVLLSGYPVARLGPGAGFGERALIRSTTRAATVRTLTPATMYAIDRISFLAAITGLPPEELEGLELPIADTAHDPASLPLSEVLSHVPLLAKLDRAGIDRLVETATIEEWEPGSVMIREGESGTDMYVILSGRAQTTAGGEHLGDLCPGDTFGEIALLHGISRSATVAATERSRTCRLSIDALSGGGAL